MEIIERKSKNRENLGNYILEVALGLAKNEGWNGLSMRKIAQLIDYSVPVIYEYYPSKEDLLSELRKNGFELLNQRLEASIAHERAPQKKISKLSHAFWNFAFENPAYYELMFQKNTFQVADEAYNEGQLRTVGIFTDAIHWLSPSSRYDENLTSELVDYLLALLHGMINIVNAKVNFTLENETEKLRKIIERFIRSVSLFA